MQESVNKNPDFKRQYVEGRIRQEVLFQEALKRGYLNDPKVQADVKRAVSAALSRAESKHIEETVDVTEAEAKAYYDANLKDYKQPEKNQVDFIFVPFGDDKAAALTKVKDHYKKSLASAKEFERIFHEDIRRDKNIEKDMRPKSQEETVAIFGKAISDALWNFNPKSKFTSIMSNEKGYYILRKPSHRPGFDKEFASVKDEVQKRATNQKRKTTFTNWVEDLKKTYKTQVFEDGLAKLDVTKVPASAKAAENTKRL